jgi:hypothetical protein
MEWLKVDYAEDIRQGDILMDKPPRGQRPTQIAVVITADCDIAQDKFGTDLACLRVVWYEEYVRHVWAGLERQKALKKISTKVGDQLRKAHRLFTGKTSTLSDERACEWLRDAELAEVASALGISNDAREKFIRNLEPSRAALQAVTKNISAFDHCVALQAALDGTDRPAAVRKLVDKAQTADLPDDAFFLPGLPDHDESPAVVLLRGLVAVPAVNVARTLSDATSPAQRVRVARLHPTYKHALTQAFGNLYARIGMPVAFEKRVTFARKHLATLEWT